jgi:hypothetical protein
MEKEDCYNSLYFFIYKELYRVIEFNMYFFSHFQ